MIKIIIWVSLTLIATVLYYIFVFKPNQNEKNKAKQEAKKRNDLDKLYKAAPTGFLHNRYEGFEDTPMMEK